MEQAEIYSKWLISFEKTRGTNNKIINLNKLMASVLLLTKESPSDKIQLLFGIYAIGEETQTGVMKRAAVR